MKRKLWILVAVGLLVTSIAVGVDEAFGGFDVATGTGVLGVGQVQPPGLDAPPVGLEASIVRRWAFTWDCVLKTNPTNVAHQHGSYFETFTSVADVKVNPSGSPLNYRFDGWEVEKELIETSHPLSGAYYQQGFAYLLEPVCIAVERELANLETEMTIEQPLTFTPTY